MGGLWLASACSEIPPQAYHHRGDPEDLLDVSSEVITLNLASASSIRQLSSVVGKEAPTRAELSCSLQERLCSQAKALLERRNVPVRMADNDASVVLVYERVVARDCQQRYIDNSINPYNLNHPVYGCSVMGNTVQMVSDKQQFTDPALLDLQDAEKAQQVYGRYTRPSTKREDDTPNWSLQQGGAN